MLKGTLVPFHPDLRPSNSKHSPGLHTRFQFSSGAAQSNDSFTLFSNRFAKDRLRNRDFAGKRSFKNCEAVFIPVHKQPILGSKARWNLRLHLLRDLLQPRDWLGKIDLKDAYFVIPIRENHRKYLRFIWKNTLLEFVCLP